MYVDYLVNNVGFGLYGKFIEIVLDEELNMIDLNIWVLIYLIKLFLLDMIKRNCGKILNVVFVVVFMLGLFMMVYYVMKVYVLFFIEVFENELRGINVMVSVLCLGLIKMGFSDWV